MNAHRYSAGCPACGHRFIAWRVWQISRWSCMHCPRCDARLVRRLDWQCWTVSSLGIVLMLLIVWIPIPLVWQMVLAVGVITLYWYIDAITVRLVEPGRWRGILGYDS